MPCPTTLRSHGPVIVDFESRSRANLKRRGGRLYWEDPSSEAICAVLYDVDSGEYATWQPGDHPPRLRYGIAHNASTFDRFAALASGWYVAAWEDSSQAARRAGLPGALDKLGQRWLGRAKDKEGNKLTLSLSRPSRAKATAGQLPEITPEKRARVLAYCQDDVEILAAAWDDLEPWFDVDAEVCRVDRIVNDRGITLDVDLVRALQRQIQRQQETAVRRAAKALGQSYELTRAQASSPQQLTAATGLPNAQAETLREAAAKGNAHPLIAARQALASVVPGKLTAALERTSPEDGRMRDSLHYYGAHTGRWSSKGMQIHNLPRVGFEDDAHKIGWRCEDYISALVEGACSDEVLTKRQVSGLLRACLVAAPGMVLSVLDYRGIEARVNAWAASDAKALDVFRALDAGTGPDPYRVMAAKIFGGSPADVSKDGRGIGKIAELACGYAMGGPKFQEGNDRALRAAGVEGAEVVRMWRELHAPIVRMWRDCEKAFAAACHGRSVRAGRWTYEAHTSTVRGRVDVWCVLPSGRPIVYPDARAKRVQRRARNGNTFDALELSYQGAREWREHVYGGLLVENAVQAVSRDLLADAFVRAERVGLCPVLTVHDELVCEVDRAAGAEALAEQREIMLDVPSWARGLPMGTDGFAEARYRK